MFILGGQIRVTWEHGFGELLRMVSPLNLAFYGTTALILAPGAALVVIGKWLAARRLRRRRRTSYLTD
jgi:cytochrome c-type biogenesis protein CcmH/NrfF